MKSVYDGVAVVIQARIGSTRLPKKALKLLGTKPILAHTLEIMKHVPAERYILACDYESVQSFVSLAEQYGYTLVCGHGTDVLVRFCEVIKKFEHSLRPIHTIIRATADNPFLFADAAAASVERFIELDEPDYFTFTGLPHGCGIEVLKAQSLLTAEQYTAGDSYAREHVGPALYNYPKRFRCIREASPTEWYFPHFRTTVDTEEDFIHAEMMMCYIENNGYADPLSSQVILDSCRYADRMAVFIPSVKAGRGTGHIRRVCSLIKELADKIRCAIYIPKGHIPAFAETVIQRAGITAIVRELPSRACLIVVDNFSTAQEEVLRLQKIAPVVLIDNSGTGRMVADYVLDILPTVSDKKSGKCKAVLANMVSTAFIPLPVSRKSAGEYQKYIKNDRFFLRLSDAKILVACGGEDASHMAMPIAETIAGLGADVTVIDPHKPEYVPFRVNMHIHASIPDLKEQLHEWDVVITHYGFTAFEALAAGCAVILIAPTEYHYRLAAYNGFSALPCGIPTAVDFSNIFAKGIAIPQSVTPQSGTRSLADFIMTLANGIRQQCPLCGSPADTLPVGRAENKTVVQCNICDMYYPSFIAGEQKNYGEQYFFDEYQAQYGKTYLDDFESIKLQGLRRMEHICQIYAAVFENATQKAQLDDVTMCGKKLLDIGCAYGPFLSAAKDSGWNPIGTDISSAAVRFVCGSLQLPACIAPFPALPDNFPFILHTGFTKKTNEKLIVPLQEGSFSAVTMWFVIEHFQDVDSVLRKVYRLLVPGGIFAFSTPALSGVSGRWSRNSFFTQSPTDHYTLWDMRTVRNQLLHYGFLVKKQVSIGHHPERFPYAAHIKKGGVIWNILLLISKVLKLGDSMEIYAIKRGS